MLKHNFEKRPKFIALVILLLLYLSYLSTCKPSSISDESFKPKAVSSAVHYKPFIVYYSRTGTTRIVAFELMNQLFCEIGEVKSKKYRGGFLGAFICVLDQLLDRYDIIEIFTKDLESYSLIIIASPIWIHRLCSPIRTFIKEVGLEGKEVYLFLTNNGDFSKENKNDIKRVLTSQKIKVKGMYAILTEDKTEVEIKRATRESLDTMLKTMESSNPDNRDFEV